MVNSSISDPELDLVERTVRNIENYREVIREGISRAVDDVVDPIRGARWSIGTLTQPEKTVIGIRVEHILRMDLGLPRPKHLDIVVAGIGVDIKFTIGTNWMIPQEADGEILLITRFDEARHEVWAGLQRARPEWLNPGRNRDTKRGFNQTGMAGIRWLVSGERPTSSIITFMSGVGEEVREHLTDSSVAAQVRLNRLFARFKNQPIPETLVEAVAQHRDWTRRMRPDKSNVRSPEQQGYEVLRQSSPKDRRRVKELGLPSLPKGYCMSVDISGEMS